MRYQIIQLVLLVPAGDESAIANVEDHALDYPDQIVSWGETSHEAGCKQLTQEQAADEFRRLTGKTPAFRAELDDE